MPDNYMSPTSEAPAKRWYQSTWKLVLAIVVPLLLLIVLFVFAIFALVFGILRNSDVCQQAFAMAKANPEVRARLGEPIEMGWLVSGQINVTGASGHADISIPISGPKSSATIYARADKTLGRWEFQRLEVEFGSGGPRTVLVPADSPPAP